MKFARRKTECSMFSYVDVVLAIVILFRIAHLMTNSVDIMRHPQGVQENVNKSGKEYLDSEAR